MKKIRHSKFRNTGILFELLTRQITADIIAGTDDSKAKEILFKYFKENTELGKEWRLYNFILNEKVKDTTFAERFLSVILEQRKKLSDAKLLREKYQLIKEIKETYPIDEFLKSNIRNYKTLASIFKLFEDATSKDVKFDVREIYKAKTYLVEHVSDRKKSPSEEENLLKFYEQQSEEIRLLSYRLLVDGLNKKYKSLDDDQKSVLREYINNISNTNSLGTFICEKIGDVKAQLTELNTKIKDSEVVKIKINEVIHQLGRIKPSKVVKDGIIMTVLLSYELIKSIKDTINK